MNEEKKHNKITVEKLKEYGFKKNETFKQNEMWHKFWTTEEGVKVRIEIYDTVRKIEEISNDLVMGDNSEQPQEHWMCNVQKPLNNLICEVANFDEVKTCLDAAHINADYVLSNALL